MERTDEGAGEDQRGVQGLNALRRGSELTLYLETFALEGKSVARHNGLVVFVEGGVAGDQVRARLTKVKKNFAEATILELLAPSPLRLEPRCKSFGTCGGCRWQHVNYQAQLDFKRQHVVDSLARIGGFENLAVNPTLGSPEIFFYRNKMEFSFGERWLTREELAARTSNPYPPTSHDRFALGLHISQRFDRVLDVRECWLQSELSTRILNLTREFCIARDLSFYSTSSHTGYLRNLVIREGKHTGEVMVNLVTTHDEPELLSSFTRTLLAEIPQVTTVVNNITQRKSLVALGDEERILHGPGYITERLGTRVYRISANSFFQTNTLQAERLFDAVRQMADLKSNDVVLDLYSGTGAIALHVAGGVREVIGIEAVESAVADAQRNASFNNVKNCFFVSGDLKDRLTRDRSWMDKHPRPTVAIVDPPRSGMHEKVVRELLAISPERIVYVSCNPSTQARDLKLLCTDSTYRIGEVQPVDMFPHTSHVENVVALRAYP